MVSLHLVFQPKKKDFFILLNIYVDVLEVEGFVVKMVRHCIHVVRTTYVESSTCVVIG